MDFARSPHRPRRRGASLSLRLFLIGALLGAGPPVRAEDAAAPPPAPGTSGQARLLGVVRSPDGAPLAGATVIAYHLRHDRSFRSTPTNPKGKFELTELPLGYYQVAVEEPGGELFVGSAVVNLPPSGKAILQVTLAPYAPGEPPGSFGNPASADAADGVARLQRRMTQSEFWKSPKGVAILAGVGGGGLLLWAAGSSDDDEVIATPTVPTPQTLRQPGGRH